VFIAVGTPSRRGDGHADLSYVYAAAREIAAALSGFTVVVTKSTVPVGTGDEVERLIREANPSADVVVASNPEFLREGARSATSNSPTASWSALGRARPQGAWRRLPAAVAQSGAADVHRARRTAELIKYAANAFLATKITFINEIADLPKRSAPTCRKVARGIGLDNRIGTKFLHAGRALAVPVFPRTSAAGQVALGSRRAAAHHRGGAGRQRQSQARDGAQGLQRVGGSLRGKTVAVLGLTFKPDTDDMREAPSIPLVTGLLDMGAKVRAHDPVGMEQARKELPDIEYCDDPYACVKGADAMVIVTEWVQFRALDLDRIKREMAQPVIVDLRNIYRPEDMAAHGFTYDSVGRAAGPQG
jgi:UDPglucose 6-dehydrogenase